MTHHINSLLGFCVRDCTRIKKTCACLTEIKALNRMCHYVACAVNPEAYKEATGKTKKALNPKKVVVIGAGVGGMEAARRAALSGHKVDLYEKGSKLGGLLIAAGAQALKKDIYQLIDWYEGELRDLGVNVHLNCTMTPDMVKAEHPDAVILSTGSAPAKMSFMQKLPVAPLLLQ